MIPTQDMAQALLAKAILCREPGEDLAVSGGTGHLQDLTWEQATKLVASLHDDAERCFPGLIAQESEEDQQDLKESYAQNLAAMRAAQPDGHFHVRKVGPS